MTYQRYVSDVICKFMFYNFLNMDLIKKVNQENNDFFDLCSNESLEEDIARSELIEAIQKECEEVLINY